MKIEKNINLKHIGFLVWLHSYYGTTVQASYRTIANQIGGITYEAVRLYLNALEKKGLITIENKGSRKHIYHLNGNELKRLLNE